MSVCVSVPVGVCVCMLSVRAMQAQLQSVELTITNLRSDSQAEYSAFRGKHLYECLCLWKGFCALLHSQTANGTQMADT